MAHPSGSSVACRLLVCSSSAARRQLVGSLSALRRLFSLSAACRLIGVSSAARRQLASSRMAGYMSFKVDHVARTMAWPQGGWWHCQRNSLSSDVFPSMVPQWQSSVRKYNRTFKISFFFGSMRNQMRFSRRRDVLFRSDLGSFEFETSAGEAPKFVVRWRALQNKRETAIYGP